jgi:hypothetical protein
MNKMMQSKIAVSSADASGRIVSILEIGGLYECRSAIWYTYDLKTYDPVTFEPAPPSLIVKCEDGKERRYLAEHFIDLQAAREIKLGQLGI